MKRQVIFTVSESKRLIAKAVAAMDVVKKALEDGIIVIAKGSTNSYVVEELLSKKIDKRAYLTGTVTPTKPLTSGMPEPKPMKDIVLVKGVVDESLDRFTAVEKMSKGDVYIKGANALNYKEKVAGILIGSKDGGTIGRTIGHIVGRKINLIIPVGLEKLVYESVWELARKMNSPDSEGPSLMPVTGLIVTEIEALKILTGVDATLVSSGGIAGAEGAVRLLIEGSKEQIEKTLSLLQTIKGEPPLML